MARFLSITSSDAVSRNNMRIDISGLHEGLRYCWPEGVPMHIGHDRHTLLGWTRMFGLHLEPEARLREVNLMQDYLHQLKSGEKRASLDWLNTSSLPFPEDFDEEMNRLGSSGAEIDALLAQVDRIERALNDRKDELLRGGPMS